MAPLLLFLLTAFCCLSVLLLLIVVNYKPNMAFLILIEHYFLGLGRNLCPNVSNVSFVSIILLIHVQFISYNNPMSSCKCYCLGN